MPPATAATPTAMIRRKGRKRFMGPFKTERETRSVKRGEGQARFRIIRCDGSLFFGSDQTKNHAFPLPVPASKQQRAEFEDEAVIQFEWRRSCPPKSLRK